MKRNNFSISILAAAAALLSAGQAFAQADATNFNRRASGGADVRQEVLSAEAPAAPPTVSAWLKQTAGKTFRVAMTRGSLGVQVASDGSAAVIRRYHADGREIASASLYPTSTTWWRGATSSSGQFPHPDHVFGVSLTPAGVEIHGRASVTAWECGTMDSGCTNVTRDYYEVGVLPVDYMERNGTGTSFARHQVFPFPEYVTAMRTQ